MILLWLVYPLRWWAVPSVIALSPEVVTGNIFIPLAAMALLGFRHPAAWAFSALTKVVPTVMPLWWIVRREWRPLAIWASSTVTITVVSAAIAPDLWSDWLRHLFVWATRSQTALGAPLMPPLVYRAPVGLALLIVGARRGWRWTVPVTAMLCTPVFWMGTYAWLAAIPRIRAGHPRGPASASGEPARHPDGVFSL